MAEPIVLASGSAIRAQLLRQAGLDIAIDIARVDEPVIRAALLAEGANPLDVVDALAEHKAMRVSSRQPGALVLGCDQVLVHDGDILGKPEDVATARAQLLRLRGQTHRLISAVVAFRDGEPLWRHAAEARLTMRDFSDDFLDGYLARHGDTLSLSPGAYRVEDEGIRLFARIDGDYFTILGLPLLPLLSWLALRGTIPS